MNYHFFGLYDTTKPIGEDNETTTDNAMVPFKELLILGFNLPPIYITGEGDFILVFNKFRHK